MEFSIRNFKFRLLVSYSMFHALLYAFSNPQSEITLTPLLHALG
jgi:hypothetical protein